MKKLLLKIKNGVVFVYNKTHWFTDSEAWAVFRFFAILEGVGWTLLIFGIIYRNLGLPEGPSVVSFAGHTHGMIMAVFYIIVLVTARSMKWGIWRVLTALASGIPPYGTIMFEQAMAWHRKKKPVFIEPPVEARG